VLVPRQEYSRELKLAAMREIDSGKGMAEVARMYQLSPKRLETWRCEWRAKGELAFPGKGAQPQSKLDANRISELERKIGQQAMEIDFLKKTLRRFREQRLPVASQWRHRLYEQILARPTDSQEAAEAGGNRERALPGRGNKSGGLLPFPAMRKNQAHGYGST
jgi:transposase